MIIQRIPWNAGLLAAFFVVAGVNHFANPTPYLTMMPAYLPAPTALIEISGVAEVMGGLGVLYSGTRVFAGWGLIMLLIAVFPANLNAALHGWPDVSLPSWILWLRLPFQLLFIWWVYRVCISKTRVDRTEARM